MAPILLALGASLAWGSSDFLAGLKSRDLAVLWVLLVSQGAGFVLVLMAVTAAGEPLPGGWTLAWAAGAGVAGLIGFAALYRALSRGAMGVVAPISALAAVVPLCVGLAAGVMPTPLAAAGMIVALVGAVVASLEPGRDGARKRAATGIALALVAAVGFGAFFVGLDEAADDGALWAVAFSRSAAFAVVVAMVAFLRPPCDVDGRVFGMLAVVGALDVFADALFAVALTLGLAAVVSVLGSLYPLATVLLARVVLHERVAGHQRAGAMAALGGIALLSLG